MQKLIGKKIGMTSFFDADGNNIPCTVIEAGPCVVTQVKTIDKDGVNSVQIAWGEKKEKLWKKSEIGHFQVASTTPKKFVTEVKNPRIERKLGEVFDVTIFHEGEYLDVIAKSKGKGFQGVVKRHGFSGVGESTHGQKNRLRAPGSIGAASTPARVFKGMKMGGRMGNTKVKMTNLEIIKIDSDKNIIIVKGAVPGYNGATVVLEN